MRLDRQFVRFELRSLLAGPQADGGPAAVSDFLFLARQPLYWRPRLTSPISRSRGNQIRDKPNTKLDTAKRPDGLFASVIEATSICSPRTDNFDVRNMRAAEVILDVLE